MARWLLILKLGCMSYAGAHATDIGINSTDQNR
jgi:hypothetical protein